MPNPLCFQLLHQSYRNEHISGTSSSNSDLSESINVHFSAHLFPEVTFSSSPSHFLFPSLCNQHKTQRVPGCHRLIVKEGKRSQLLLITLPWFSLPSPWILYRATVLNFLGIICVVHLNAEHLSWVLGSSSVLKPHRSRAAAFLLWCGRSCIEPMSGLCRDEKRVLGSTVRNTCGRTFWPDVTQIFTASCKQSLSYKTWTDFKSCRWRITFWNSDYH